MSTAVAGIFGAGTAQAAVVAPAEGVVVGAGSADAIEGRYIVTLKNAPEGVPAAADELAASVGGQVEDVYATAVKGFSVEASEDAAKRLAADPDVATVEQDRIVHLDGTQSSAPWGLDRIDQPNRPLSGTFTYPSTAANVTAYILDTGVRLTHAEFGGRARSGYDFIDNDADASDCQGHGTHVAGTVAGSTYGVAKQASIVSVRVLDCSGNGAYSAIIAGVEWVTTNAVKPAVANMSLGGSASATLDTAVRASIASGVTYAVAAGNENTDACTVSPARTSEAITVAAIDQTDTRASFSNYGACVDLFAPGVGITSSTKTSDSSTGGMSGTSMATPHVAGVAALALAEDPTATPAQVSSRIAGVASTVAVTNAAGSPSRILQVPTAVDSFYNALTPVRVLDTRTGVGSPAGVGPGKTIDVQLTGVGGVPSSGVGAVVLNLTGTQPTVGTYVTVYPTGQARPGASNLNLVAGETGSNLVMAKVGTGGKVTLFNNGGVTHLIADVVGWLPSTSDYGPLVPARVLDTRTGVGGPVAAVGPAKTVDVQVTGVGGVPSSGVGAVVLNLTGTQPSVGTYVTAYPSGQALPGASTLNLAAGQTAANLVVVKVGAGGKVRLYNNGGWVNLIADVVGWLPTTSDYTSLVPSRVLDTRTGTGAPVASVGQGRSIDFKVTGVGGVPSTGVGAVVLNLTATQPSTSTFVTAYPAGQTLPGASNINLTPGETTANLVIVKVGTGGKATLYNHGGNVHLIADVVGWMPGVTPGGVAPSGAMSTTEFIAASAEPAQQGWREFGVPPSVTMAQGILESGWGKSKLSTNDRNFFGIKCFSNNPGSIAVGCASYATSECNSAGVCAPTTATFRSYASTSDSYRDHGYFLRHNSRYNPAFAFTTDANKFIDAIWRAGYATDPQYVSKVTALMQKYNLYQYDTWA